MKIVITLLVSIFITYHYVNPKAQPQRGCAHKSTLFFYKYMSTRVLSMWLRRVRESSRINQTLQRYLSYYPPTRYPHRQRDFSPHSCKERVKFLASVLNQHSLTNLKTNRVTKGLVYIRIRCWFH